MLREIAGRGTKHEAIDTEHDEKEPQKERSARHEITDRESKFQIIVDSDNMYKYIPIEWGDLRNITTT